LNPPFACPPSRSRKTSRAYTRERTESLITPERRESELPDKSAEEEAPVCGMPFLMEVAV